MHVRIDSIEQAIRDSGQEVVDAGYRVGYAIAADNLIIGRTVVADSVNPLTLTRDAWIAVASSAHVQAVEVEVICSDAKQHRHQVEARVSDAPGLPPLTWQEVISRNYQPWNRERVVIDTAGKSVEQSVEDLRAQIKTPRRREL